MEADDETHCTFATNWTIISGCLCDSISFESSNSPIVDAADSSSSSSKPPPLVLYSPSPDPSPCEIKIGFTQKHEVCQVYVRSSAQVYEIYFATDAQSSNDYLCTVRCGGAAKDEELVNAIDIDEEVLHHLKTSSKRPTEDKSGNDNNSSNHEDDWVEVKAPDSPPLNNGDGSLLTKIVTNQGRGREVLYEATAEISDANPCISLTLRLLSLENKGRVYVDEIYIFADPVQTIDLENQMGSVENSAGSPLMTMLVPALLQLSKTSGSQAQEKHVSDSRERLNFEEFGSETSKSTNFADKIQEVKSQRTCAVTAEPAESQTLPEASNTEREPCCTGKEHSMPHDHLESSLDQIVSRLARVEDLFLRFEKSMLRPINSIETRLQHVEQQLEALDKKSQSSEFPSCLKFAAPELTYSGSDSFSSYNDGNDNPTCVVQHLEQVDTEARNSEMHSYSRFVAPEFNPSDSGSFYNDGGDNSTCGAVESEKKEFPCEKVCITLNDMPVSVSRSNQLPTPLDDTPESAITTCPFPSLVVTSPEFPSTDDEKETDAFELETDLRAEGKKPLSIDDALASALAGFLSSSTVQPSTSTPILTVNAPEFSSEDDGNNSIIALQKAECEPPAKLAFLQSETNGAECVELPTSSNMSSLEGEEKLARDLIETDYNQICEEVVDNLCNEVDREAGVGCEVFGAEQDEATADKKEKTRKTNPGEDSNEARGFLESDSMYSPPFRLLEDEANVASEVTKEGCEEVILQDVLHISNSLSAMVDFEIPILDVKFVSQDVSYSISSLEDLLWTGIEEGNGFEEQNDD